MSLNVRLKAVFGPACLLAALFALPRFAGSQTATQVHPITGLPLPADDEKAVPATRLVPAAIPSAEKPATVHKQEEKAEKNQKIRHAPAVGNAAPEVEAPKAAETPAVVPAPAAVAAATPVAPALTTATKQKTYRAEARKGRRSKPLLVAKPQHEAVKPQHEAEKAEPVAAPVVVDNTVHPIRLPLPPDEEPKAPVLTPKPAEPAKSIAVPKVETPKHAAEAKHEAVKPVPVLTPVEVQPEPRPEILRSTPTPQPETPKVEAPKVDTSKPVGPKHEVVVPPAAKIDAPRAVEAKRVAPVAAPATKDVTKSVEGMPPSKHETTAVAPARIVPTPKLELPTPIAVEESKPTLKPTGSPVIAPKIVADPVSVVPEEVLPKPVAVAPAPKSAKPQPTLKPRPTGSATVIISSPIPSAAPVAEHFSIVAAPPPVASPKPPAPATSVVAPPRSMTPNTALAVTPAVAPMEGSAPPPPPPGTLGHILFHGAAPFNDSELAPLTGLTIGTKPTSESLQIASNRLIETGLFYNVTASYDTPNDVGTATFTLEALPASQLARVSFANLVWMTSAEIDETLKLLPLYRGVVPMGGNLRMAESIQATLEGALSARGVQATLSYSLIPPSPQHPYTALEFRVLSPSVVLGSASLFDIPPALVNRTLQAQTDAVKLSYNEGIAGTTLSDILLAPARNAGYIGARLWHIERKRHILGKNIVSVDYVARVDAGPIYTVRALNWEPTSVLSDADFHRLTPMHVGQTPTSDAVTGTQQVITDAYYAQGYMEASISAKQELETKTGAAYYTYSAIAGPQYRIHNVTVQGLSDEAKRDFDAAWRMKDGDIYNEGYLLNFLNTHQDLTSLKGYTFTYGRSTAPDTHQVDLTLTFKK